MVIWILLFLVLLFVGMRVREHYVEISGPGARPTKTADWLSKIDAEAPIGGNDDEYLRVLQKFYDEVYFPARAPPGGNPDAFIDDTAVKAFADSITIPSVDKDAIRKIITAGFAVQRTGSAAAREEQQIVKTGALADFKGENLEPKDGVDDLYPNFFRSVYVPADGRIGSLPEGVYTPTEQQEEPRREGDYDDRSTSWTDVKFQGV
jgi:hypothetical protein